MIFKEIYPKVVLANNSHTIYFSLDASETELISIEAKLQPMEAHTVSHFPNYLSHDEERYPWIPLSDSGDGLFCAKFEFGTEQRYSLKLRIGEEIVYSGYAYAIDGDLAELHPYKGDTHLHTNCSDGWEPPFETACAYRAAGYDFIAITDHGRYYPSIDTQAMIAPLTECFRILPGEEVHPKGGSYFHIVSLNARYGVSEILEKQHDYVRAETEKIIAERDLSSLPDPYAAAFRIFVANEIRKAGGVAIMAHPFWESGGEYNMQTEEFLFHMRNGDFDVLELPAGNDNEANGNNLEELLWHELKAEGCRIPIVGASDGHVPRVRTSYDFFNLQFSIVFAKGYEEIPSAILEGRAVAIDRRDDRYFRCIGNYRYAKYARFLMREYFPAYSSLTAAHASALSKRNRAAIADSEKNIDSFNEKFFSL